MSTQTLPEASTAPSPRLPSAMSVGLGRIGIELKQFFRQKESVVFTFAFPIVMMVIFGSVFSGQTIEGTNVKFSQYFAAGMIATGVMLSSFQSLAILITLERDDGTLKRLRGTPMPPLSYFIGKIGMVLVSSIIQTAILLGISALLLDLTLPQTPQLWLRFAWIFLLGTVAGTVLGIAFSSLPRSGRSAPAVVTPVMIVLQFISGVYFIFSSLPQWMQHVGAVFPLKWLSQGMRSVLLPDSFMWQEPAGSWELVRAALIMGLWALVGLVFSLLTFRWLPRRDK